jgi:hypothetical protein
MHYKFSPSALCQEVNSHFRVIHLVNIPQNVGPNENYIIVLYSLSLSLSLKMNFITPNSSKLLIVLHFHHLFGLKWGLSKFINFLKGKSCLFTIVYNITIL